MATCKKQGSGNDRFIVCLSHDVDHVNKTFQFLTHFLKALFSGRKDSALYQLSSLFLRGHYWGFDRIMDLESQWGVRSTFFFLNETYPFRILKPSSWNLSLGYYNMLSPALREVIERLDKGGWEIGLHGSYRSYCDGFLIRKEKEDLERIINHPVAGIRQHYLNLDDNTWDLQREAGFLYDASWGYTNKIGFRDEKMRAFRTSDNPQFWVVPLSLMDSCVMRSTSPFEDALRIIGTACDNDGCIVLNWHQRMFNEKEFPGYTNMYIKLVDECRSRGARFLTIGEYIDFSTSQSATRQL